jgi:hypothetical protein
VQGGHPLSVLENTTSGIAECVFFRLKIGNLFGQEMCLANSDGQRIATKLRGRPQRVHRELKTVFALP